MSDDSEAKQERVTSVIYLKVLEEQMSMLWESDLIYMQNEASIHTACIIKKWLADNEIEVIDWFLYSSDLNLIEHIWRHLKEWVHEHWDSNKWKIFLWSNECSVKCDSDRKQQWMFHTSAQKWDKKMIQLYNKNKNKSVMI